MKKILFILMFSSLFAQDSSQDETQPATLSIRGGVDVFGDIQFNYLLEDIEDDLELGYTLGADLIFIKTNYIDIGVGYEIQLERELDEMGGKIGFNSYYVDVANKSGFFVRIGKNNFHGDDTFTSDGYFRLEGSLYTSTGARIKYNDESYMEIAYNSYMGDIYWGNDDSMWVEYDTFNISWGYYIDFDPNN